MRKDREELSDHEDRGSGSREPTLPPLHQVLGDLLVHPTSPTLSRQVSSDSGRSVRDGSSPRSRGPQLAPIARSSPPRSQPGRHTSPPAPQASSSARRLGPAPSSMRVPTRSCPPPETPSQYSYDLFNCTPNQGLVHQRSSTQDDLDESRSKTRVSATQDSSRRYACAVCGKRFQKPSTLKNHTLTHTGEKPFTCTQCGKGFSMASNMQRHMRTHASGSAFQVVPVEGTSGEDEPRSPSSRRTSPGEY